MVDELGQSVTVPLKITLVVSMEPVLFLTIQERLFVLKEASQLFPHFRRVLVAVDLSGMFGRDRQDLVFKRNSGSDEGVFRTKAENRRVEVLETICCNASGNLGAPAQCQ